MTEQLDDVEREYLARMSTAGNEEAFELSIGLRQYRELYKIPHRGCMHCIAGSKSS